MKNPQRSEPLGITGAQATFEDVKREQEWTPKDVVRIWQGERTPKNDNEGMQRLADAHNAALAAAYKLYRATLTVAEIQAKELDAERENSKERGLLLVALRRELLSEREKVKSLVDTLERLRERFKRYNGLPIGSDDVKIINDALAKAKP